MAFEATRNRRDGLYSRLSGDLEGYSGDEDEDSTGEDAEKPPRRRGKLLTRANMRTGAAWLVTAAAVVALAWLGGSGRLSPLFIKVLRWSEGLGVVGPLVLFLAIAATVPMLLPSFFLNIGAGFLFKGLGYPVALLGCTLGASISFALARSCLAARLAPRVSTWRHYATLRYMLGRESAKRGALGFSWAELKVTLLCRASPIFPFPWLNYLMGLLPELGLVPYALGTMLGMMPWVGIDVVMGSLLQDYAELEHFGHSTGYLVAFGVVSVLCTAAVTLEVRRLLGAARLEMEAEAEPGRQGDVRLCELQHGADGGAADDDRLLLAHEAEAPPPPTPLRAQGGGA